MMNARELNWHYINKYIDAFYFGDDWGQQKGLIMGPEHWRRFIKPCLARLYAAGKGKLVAQHSCGGISTQRLLPFATPEEVRRVTRETIRIMGEDGGYIAAPTHAVPGDVPPENVLAMLELFRER